MMKNYDENYDEKIMMKMTMKNYDENYEGRMENDDEPGWRVLHHDTPHPIRANVPNLLYFVICCCLLLCSLSQLAILVIL